MMLIPSSARRILDVRMILPISCTVLWIAFLVGTTLPAGAAARSLPRSHPEAQGVNSSNLLAFVEAVDSQRLNLHSLMVLRHGHVVAEGWWAPYAPEWRHTLYSLSKSFTSTAVGLAVGEGKLRLEDRVIGFFPDELPSNVSSNLAAMQVKHLLMMGSGHGSEALFGSGFSITNRTQNWVRTILSRPVEFPPGSHFTYNNGATYLLSAIVRKVTGQTVLDYLTPRLFAPLGIEDADWEQSPQGINSGGFGLRVKTEDIAKLGQLYLQKGVWKGRRILSKEWVQAATSLQISNAPAGDPTKAQTSDWAQGYGYQFWRCRHGAYRGDGASGQYCLVLPEQDAVIAITAETADMQAVLNLVWDKLLPGFSVRPIASDAALLAALETKLRLLMLPMPAGRLTSPEALRIGDRVYQLADNPLGWRSFSVSFAGNDCTVALQDRQGDHSIICGFGKWVDGSTRLSPSPLHLATTTTFGKSPLSASAAWSDSNTLEMDWRFVETAHYQRVILRFDGDEVKLRVKKGASLLNPSSKDEGQLITGKSMPPTK